MMYMYICTMSYIDVCTIDHMQQADLVHPVPCQVQPSLASHHPGLAGGGAQRGYWGLPPLPPSPLPPHQLEEAYGNTTV